MRIFIVIFFIGFTFLSSAQHQFSKEFSLISDNDLYTSIHRDGYYTNGLFLTFRTIKNDVSENAPKKIYKFQVGQLMFTALRANIQTASLHDRPFAAYLYGSFGINWFYNSNNILTTDIEIGVIGPSAQGKELQNFLHGFYNFPEPLGWKHQIENAFALNFNASYLHHFSKASTNQFDISSFSTFKTGTVFTNLSIGIYSRFGFKKLQPFSNSVAFNSNLNIAFKSYSESFIFVKPMLNYALYDATIQGSFLNKTSIVTYDVMPFHFSLDVGYRFYKKRFLYGYTFTYHTKKLKSDRIKKGNNYGSIYIGYFFN
mgnify:CR=1 FL=1